MTRSYSNLSDSATTFDPEEQFDKDRAGEEHKGISKGLDQALTDELANRPASIMKED
jgi:hypothetical protein